MSNAKSAARSGFRLVLAIGIVLAGCAGAAQARDGRKWFRGQLHAHTYWSDGRAFPEQAIEAYKRAIECDPDCADAHCNLGSVYFNQDRLASSRACFEHTLVIDPHHVEANLNLATLLEDEGRYQMALRHYKVALDAEPMYADAHVSLALVYEKIGLRRKARGHWRRYLQLEPSGTWVEIARQRLQQE